MNTSNRKRDPHVYSSPPELASAREKIGRYPWAQAALNEQLGHSATRRVGGLPGDSVWRLALAGRLAGCEATLQKAVETLGRVRDIVAECGGNVLIMSWGMNPYTAGFELLRERLPDGEEDRILSMLRKAAQAIVDHNRHDANCQTMYNAALSGVGLLVAEKAWVECALHDETRGLLSHLRRCVSSDGLWWEGSVAYHLEVILAVQIQVEMLRRAGQDPLADPEVAGIMKKMYDAPLGAMFPAADAFNKNDGDISNNLADWSGLYEIAYARFRDPRYAWILERGRRDSPNALLYGQACLCSEPPPSSSTVMPETGWAVLRAPLDREDYWIGEGLAALLDFGPYGGWHGHPDALSLDYHILGRFMLQDQGSSPVGYVNREHWEWFRHTLAHNTVTVDGKSQNFVFGDDDALAESGSGGRLTMSLLGGSVQAVEACCDSVYPNALYRRAVVAVGAGYLVDFFQVNIPGEHVFDYALHGSGWLTLDQSTVPAADCLRPTPQNALPRGPDAMIWNQARLLDGEWHVTGLDPHAAYGYAQEVYACQAESPIRATFHGGQWGDGRFLPGGPGLAVTLLPEGSVRVFTCRTPRRSPATHHPTLIVRRTGCRADFAAVMAPFRMAADEQQWGIFLGCSVNLTPRACAVVKAHSIAAGPDVRGIRIETDEGFDLVFHTFSECASAMIDDPAVRFDGRFCCLRFDLMGRLRDFRAADARRLEVAGKNLLNAGDGQ